ncbi:efflux RND transporter periplasmic adaptor subunit [Magnetospirillum molischianum]|uniref:Putative component of multidrug efflux pump, acrB/acrD/acrF family n=1 Tax=Magnetospirillum molischianum DSM 120 TaxID=1150626 RepID=H8FWF0_MAGML|nr:efflux RND transporter periplasmic adaptor subunit [Magnetospirillum molischianum]CCG42688.1 Putative component of multidrug efflux pump, acrB/acrD/acrF family [Magnetospirillum molischianum DSM 120]
MRVERLSRCGGMLIVAAMALAGCGDPTPEATLPPVQVAVMTVAPARVNLTEDLPGRVAAVRIAEIRPQVSGIVQRRLFEQGAEIRAGDPLFQINPAPFKADAEMAAATLQRAEAALARARIQTQRLEPLVQADAISRQTYDDAVSQRDQAAADVALARATLSRRRLDLKFATVDAPIAGRIDQALVTEGALVAPTDSSPMARIQQVDQVYVDVRQPASSLEAVREALASRQDDRNSGLPVTVLRSNGTAYDVKGRILFSGINVDSGTGDVLLRVLVDNPKRDLLPGMFVRARVSRVSYDDALMVPQQAVVRIGGKPQVWVAMEDNTASAAPVELGELIDRRYRIRAGLSAGQRIVVEGLERLNDGAAIAPRDWQPTATATH